MARGRPVGSIVRKRIAEILAMLGEAHGYVIYKHYKALFPKVSLRNIYYNLRKGVELGEFVVVKQELEQGVFSWGLSARKVYYKLGNVKPVVSQKVKSYFEKLRKTELLSNV